VAFPVVAKKVWARFGVADGCHGCTPDSNTPAIENAARDRGEKLRTLRSEGGCAWPLSDGSSSWHPGSRLGIAVHFSSSLRIELGSG